jgi:uncharacterized protein (TIGR02231 family)
MNKQEVNADIPVVQATLLEDRAHVLRRGAVSLPAGRFRICVLGVAPVIVDKTLTVRVIQGEGVRIDDAHIVREKVVLNEAKPEHIREIDSEIEALNDKIRILADRQNQKANQLKQLDHTQLLTVQEIGVDVSWSREDSARWRSDLELIHDAKSALGLDLLEIKSQDSDLQIKRNDLHQRRAIAENPAATSRTKIIIDAVSDGITDASFEIEYLVPGACWRPYHTAHLVEGDEPLVKFSTDACIWQNTGETWSDVALYFSTERPSLGVSPPSLQSDVVSARKKGDAVAVSAREEKIHTSGLGAEKKIKMPEVPGIDDGGELMHLRSLGNATVSSDGRPHRVPLSSFESPATTSLVLMPELAQCVFTKSVQHNAATQAILAGPVDLIRTSGLVGQTTAPFVAPQERFDLGWGPDANLRVQREHECLEEKSKMLSSWSTVPNLITIFASNIGPSDRVIEVTERVPVSEVEKVKITMEPKKTSDRAKPDTDGFVKWTLRLEPYSRKTLKLAYIVKKHEDVVGI